MAEATLGEKIHNFRNAKGVSQMELELQIGAAPGSISRIESGRVNPTKETLAKIIKALDIHPAEAAEFFSIDLDTIINGFSKVSKILDVNFELDKMLGMITHELVSVINGSYAGFWLWDEGTSKLYMKSHNVPKVILDIAEGAMGKSVDDIFLSADDPEQRQNYTLRSLLEGKILETTDIYDFVHSFLNRNIAGIMQRIVRMQYGLAIPLIVEGRKVGVLDIVLKNKLISPINESIIELFIDQISRSILIVQDYQNLKNKWITAS